MKSEELSESERQRVESLVRELADWQSVPLERVAVVRSPYRVCPLGAHVDHQGGVVTGFAVDHALMLAFCPRGDGLVVLRSHQFPGGEAFSVEALRPERANDWTDYARGAVAALRAAHGPLRAGMTAIVDGHDDVAGLSSSAAVGVAYLLALETVNGLDVSPRENTELDRLIENGFIGLENGILDQSCILTGRPGRLLRLDCRSGSRRLVPVGGDAQIMVVVLFSGLRAPLAATDCNQRVAECRQAAHGLLRAARPDAPADGAALLNDVQEAVYLEYADVLPNRLRMRARHYFTEQERVRRGVDLWARGDLAGFGALIARSGHSSIVNYECGNPYLRTAYEVLCRCAGVYGARFSGAGFRGCCVALVRPGREQDVAQGALADYLRVHPDMARSARAWHCRSGEAACVLE